MLVITLTDLQAVVHWVTKTHRRVIWKAQENLAILKSVTESHLHSPFCHVRWHIFTSIRNTDTFGGGHSVYTGFPGGCQCSLSANAGDLRDMGLIPGSGRSPEGGHDNPLQYSCLENPMDRGAWWATVHRSQGVAHDERLSTHVHSVYHNVLDSKAHWLIRCISIYFQLWWR